MVQGWAGLGRVAELNFGSLLCLFRRAQISSFKCPSVKIFPARLKTAQYFIKII